MTTPVVVRDRYLYNAKNGERFYMKGIAFPDPPLLKPPPATPENPNPPEVPKFNYNATAWIDILHQLRDAVPDVHALNTIRIYRLDPYIDYSEFFDAAAHLGFYILVPLTSTSSMHEDDAAVLDRSIDAPYCYKPALLQYGIRCWLNYGRYPNVLAGVIGNEVMNDLESWYAAPCVKAYAHDLKRYMRHTLQDLAENSNANNNASTLAKLFHNRVDPNNNNTILPLPLLYATQHSGIGAALNEVDTVRVAVDYLTCDSNEEEDGASNNDPDIDIFGINIESWCSTYQAFYYNEDGSTSSYYQLYRGLYHAIPVPLVFSEMGCSHTEFDKDNLELKTIEGTRDWRQIPAVLYEMNETFSGFCAYAYDGTPLFAMMMMKDGPWDGKTPLETTQDFTNFAKQLLEVEQMGYDRATTISPMPLEDSLVIHSLPMFGGGYLDAYYEELAATEQPPTCTRVQNLLRDTCDLNLLDMDDMPSYVIDQIGQEYDFPPLASITTTAPMKRIGRMSTASVVGGMVILLGIAAFAVSAIIRVQKKRKQQIQYEPIA